MTIEAKGHNGQVHFDGQWLTITRKGFLARTSVGKGDKRIPVASITAVQWKPAGPVMNGYIEFTLPGGKEKRSAFGSASIEAGQNENAVLFTRKQMPAFEKVRASVETAIAVHMSHAVPAQRIEPTVADQIAQLAGLRDQGILADEEFSAKKTELLARM